MMDIDDFKFVNDTYGHAAGDYILRNLAKVVKKVIPKNVIFSRYGGEEFVVFVPNTTIEESMNLADTIRLTIANNEFIYEGTNIHIEISIGITVQNVTSALELHQVIKEADDALYVSKRTGKNKVTLYSQK